MYMSLSAETETQTEFSGHGGFCGLGWERSGSFNCRLRARISLLLERLLALDHKVAGDCCLEGRGAGRRRVEDLGYRSSMDSTGVTGSAVSGLRASASRALQSCLRALSFLLDLSHRHAGGMLWSKGLGIRAFRIQRLGRAAWVFWMLLVAFVLA